MDKKVYLILGASSDVGLALLERLLPTLKKGDSVIAHYNTNHTELSKLLQDYPDIIIALEKANLKKDRDLLQFISHIQENYSTPTHIIHLPANKIRHMKVKNIDWNVIEEDLQIQVHSLAEVLKAFLPEMSKAHYGKVVIMLSSAVLAVPPKNMVGYIITKYALLGLLKSCAVEYSGKGICINGISPNIMETKFWNEVDPRFVQMGIENVTMKRGTKLSEAVNGIEFLLSDGSDYINGINLNMSGGDWM